MKFRTMFRRSRAVKDRGYAWVVLIMSFLSHTMHLGYGYGVIGNLTGAHVHQFNIDLQKSTFIGSGHVGFLCLFGPLASIMVKKLGCQLTQFVGGACLLLSIGLCSFSTEFWHAFLLFSLLAGFGVSATFTATSQILTDYFDKFKYFAFSFAMLGFYTGMIIWPIASQMLLDKFGYSDAMALMCIPHMIHIIAAATFIRPTGSNEPSNEIEESDTSSAEPHSCDGDEGECSEMGSKSGQFNAKVDGIDEKITPGKQEPKSVLLKDEFLHSLKAPKVWLLILNAVLWNTNVAAFLVLINDYVIRTAGVSAEDAAIGITVLGVSNMIGCLGVLLSTSLKFDRLILHFGMITLFGVTSIVSAFTVNKMMYYGLTAIWGFGNGAMIGNLLAVVGDFGEPNQFIILFGVQLLGEGVGALALAPLGSYIAEEVGHQFGIIFSGCCGIAGALAILPVIINKYRNRRTATP